MLPQNTGLTSGGGIAMSYRQMKGSLALGWQSSRDGVSVKIPVLV